MSDGENKGESTSSDVRTASEPSRRAQTLAAAALDGTISALAMERLAQGQVSARRSGERAELASLRVRLRKARAKSDIDGERALGAQLARLLAHQGRRLAEATKLARRSLLMAEDPALREELSSWFAGVGDSELAAGTLRPLTERELEGRGRAAIWMRVAVLSARGGHAAPAVQSLQAAAEADRSDPLPLELLGSLHRWAPQQVSGVDASLAFFEAAQRRRARGDVRGATDALLQAFECAPGQLPVVEQLAEELCRAGRFQAADELWREAAQHSPDSMSIHARRIRDALGYGDVALALGAALDQGADCGLDVDGISTAASLVNDGSGTVPVPNFDGLLAPGGLTELLAARLELSAEAHEGAERARALLLLARLVSATLGDPARAKRLFAEALFADPSNEGASRALRELSAGESGLTTELKALLRIANSAASGADRARALERLAQLGEQQPGARSVALWALGRLARGGLSPELRELEQRLKAAESLPPSVLPDWTSASLTELRRALAALARDPSQVAAYTEALRVIGRREPAPEWSRALTEVLWRLDELDELEQVWREELKHRGADQVAARLGLCRLLRARGRPREALALFLETPGDLDAEQAAMFSALASLHGTNPERALGLEQLARHASAPVRAALLSVASGLFASDGEASEALRLAEAACHAGPSAARPIVCYCAADPPLTSRVTLLALDRACEVAVPRVAWCRQLANHHPDPDVALRWLRRWASLSSLDAESARSLLARLVEVGDLDQLLKGLSWLLGQPMPMSELVDELISALELLVQKSPQSARTLCQRLLGVFGVRDDRIAGAISTASRTLDEPSLRAAVLERQMMAKGQERPSALIELAELRATTGQVELAYDACIRAMEVGTALDRVGEVVARLPKPDSSDAELSQLQLRARLLEHEKASPELVAMAYRDLGAGLWDLAGDARGAVQAWESASELDEVSGDEALARDLIAFCGYERAGKVLFEIAARRDTERGAALLTEAARVALEDGFAGQALTLALEALSVDPARAEALATLEQAAGEGDVEVLAGAYETARGALLGKYGERALCYRAAREFERRREHERALPQAIAAFEAVPGEGVSFALMLRLAAFVRREEEVVRALERVAQREPDQQRSSRWLERAATVAGSGVEGQRLRVEILFRALTVRASAEAVDAVGDALIALFDLDVSEREDLRQQYSELARTLLRRLEGAETAETAMALARVAAVPFADGGLCAGALRRCLQLDATAPLWEQACDWVPMLAERPGSSRPFLEELQAAAHRTPLPNPVALRFGTQLAERSAAELLPSLLVGLARQVPDEPGLVARAEAMAHDNPQLLDELRKAIELSDGASALFSRAEAMESTAPEAAAQLLEELLGREGLDAGQYSVAFARLQRLHAKTGDTKSLEALLARSLETEYLPVESRMAAARRLADLLEGRGAHAAAMDVIKLIDHLGQPTVGDLKRAAEIAAKGGDAAQEIEYLERLLSVEPVDQHAVARMRRLVALYDSQGQRAHSVGWATRVLQQAPDDGEMAGLVLRHAEQSQDWLTYAQLLHTSLAASQQPTEQQVLRLADTFANKLHDPAAAAAVIRDALERIAPTPVLWEKFAEHLMATGELAEAAECYKRASRLAREPRVAARLAELSVRGFLEAGQLETAAAVLASKSIYPQTEPLAELRVQVAARQGLPEIEAAALEELAYISMAPADKRARLLRRAAELSLEFGNQELALTRAQRAARVAPTDAETQIYARLLEYRARGAGSLDEALTTISELRSLGRLKDPELVEVRAFLLAEALERRVGPGAGAKELQIAEAQVGLQPLVALGLLEQGIERLPPERVAMLRQAVQAGDLLGLRTSEQLEAAFGGAPVRRSPSPTEPSRPAQDSLPSPFSPVSGRSAQLPRMSTQRPAAGERYGVKPTVPRGDEVGSIALPPTRAVGQYTTRPSIAPSPPAASTRKRQLSPPPKPASVSYTPRPSAFKASVSMLPKPQAVEPGRRQPRTSEKPFVFSLEPGPPAKPPSAQAIAPSPQVSLRGVPSPPRASSAPPAQDLGLAPGSDQGSRQSPRELEKTLQLPVMDPGPSQQVNVTVAADPRALGKTMVSAGKSESTKDSSGVAGGRKPSDKEHSRPSITADLDSTQLSIPPPGGDTDPTRPPKTLDDAIRRTVAPITGDGATSAFRSAGIRGRPSEQGLLEQLESGSMAAGERLLESLLEDAERIHDAVGVLRQMLSLSPGELAYVRRLEELSRRDSDLVAARALLHVVRVFDAPDEAPVAPPLHSQRHESEALVRLIAGRARRPVEEILAGLWQAAPHLFRSVFLQSGYTHVSPESASPLGQLFKTATQSFGVQRAALFHQPRFQSDGETPAQDTQSGGMRIVLDEPISLILEGSNGNPTGSVFRYHFGAAVMAMRPEYALLHGLTEEHLATVLDSVLAAFGPPRRLSGNVSQVAQFAEHLWESLPSSMQRRFQDLCERPEQITVEAAVAASRSALAKAGLFVSGDFFVSLQETCEILGLSFDVARQEAELARLCSSDPVIADLLRFACSPGYAEARWRPARGGSGTATLLV